MSRRNPTVPPPQKKKLGGQRKEIDYEQFEKLCNLQCTLAEISDFFCISEDTLEARVKEHYGQLFNVVRMQYLAVGKISLRRSQFETAVNKKNATMQIWLGQQYLGQSNKQIGTADGAKGEVVEYEVRRQLYEKVAKELPDDGDDGSVKV
jgi:hypothetical protein